jgi:hypothetical protein
VIDSVDADDGVIDGSGSTGQSWFFAVGATGVTFTFGGPLPTAAGIVWTDGAGPTTFEAFGPGLVALGTLGPVALANSSIVGTTAEDRFFGVQDPGGILALKVSNTIGGIEVDHVQCGAAASPSAAAVPEPSTLALLGLGCLSVLYYRWRRQQRGEARASVAAYGLLGGSAAACRLYGSTRVTSLSKR